MLRPEATANGATLGGRSFARHRLGPALFIALAASASLAALGGPVGAQSGPVELTYAIWDPAQQPAMQQIIDEFQAANPDISVKISVTPWDTYWTRLDTSITGGSAPDVFWVLNDRMKYYESGGALLPIDDYIQRDAVSLDNYVQSSVDGVMYNGQVFGLPKDTNSFGLFYNKTLFADAGISPPDDTWTWDTVLDAAEKLTNKDAGVYGIVAHAIDVLTWYLTIPEAGGFVISPDGKLSGYDDPKSVAGLKFWSDMINTYGVSPTMQQIAETNALSMLTSGKIAMYFGGSWDPIAISNVDYGKANIDIAPLPTNPTTGSRAFYANGIANVIAAGTKSPDAAWKFLAFLGGERAAGIQAATGTVIPAFKGQEAAYAGSFPWFNMKALTDRLSDGLPIPSSLNTAAWAGMATQEFTKAWSGSVPIEQAASDVATQMNQMLAEEQP